MKMSILALKQTQNHNASQGDTMKEIYLTKDIDGLFELWDGRPLLEFGVWEPDKGTGRITKLCARELRRLTNIRGFRKPSIRKVLSIKFELEKL